jgi:hypothetical protein
MSSGHSRRAKSLGHAEYRRGTEINPAIGLAGSDLDKKLDDAVTEAKSSDIRAILLRLMSLHAADSEDQIAVSALPR